MSKRSSQLVSQHLENISRKMLEDHQDVIRSFVRGRYGIYAMYRRGKLYYVGLASSLLGRLKAHIKDRHANNNWDRFSVYLTIGPQHMKEIESLLLRIASPSDNHVRGKFIKSENILPKVKAQYRHRREEEYEDLFGPKKRAKISPGKPDNLKSARIPTLQPYVESLSQLRARFKGKWVRAWVRRNGMIFFNSKRYTSPSAAAKAVVGHTCSGWQFWNYERGPGDWVPLKELRK